MINHNVQLTIDEVINAISQYSVSHLPSEYETVINGLVDRLAEAVARERECWENKLRDAHEVGQYFLNELNNILDKLCYIKQNCDVKK